MIEIFTIFVCLIINAIFSCGEIAFVTVKRSTCRKRLEKGDHRAGILLKLRETPEKTLSVVQIAITFVAIFAAAFGGSSAEVAITPWISETLGVKNDTASLISVFAVVVPLTYFTVVFGELAPKIIGMKNSYYFASKLAPTFQVMSKIFFPVIKVLSWSAKNIVTLFLKVVKVKKPEEEKDVLSLEDLPQQSRKYVLNIVDLQKKTVVDASLPISEIVCVHTSQTTEEVEKIAISSMHTRLPVQEDGKIKGLLHVKEFFSKLKSDSSQDWKALIRPIKKFDKCSAILPVILEMQKSHMHMALVVQNNQDLAVITLEDLIEEIVGDIYDEDDPKLIKKNSL